MRLLEFTFKFCQVIPNLYEFLSFAEHKQLYGYIKSCGAPLTSTVWRNTTVALAPQRFSYPYNLLCSAEERESYRFGTTWGWV